MSVPATLRDAVPIGIRRKLRLGQRALGDWLGGIEVRPPAPQDVSAWPLVVTVVQALGTTPHSDAKRRNISLAAAAFSGRPIPPGGSFSFWGWLGAPSRARGFADGRALRGDRLILETGGGLCQLAGALYYAGLQAGLTPIERHAHSVDLYTDETRYAPLGSDATVSYGFKDLRFRNPHFCPVTFDVRADGETLCVGVLSREAVADVQPEFRRQVQLDGTVVVETWIRGTIVARSRYKRLEG